MCLVVLLTALDTAAGQGPFDRAVLERVVGQDHDAATDHEALDRPGQGAFEDGKLVVAMSDPANVVAMDVMEVAPAYDHADVTVNNAHGLIWEALGAMSFKNRAAGR